MKSARIISIAKSDKVGLYSIWFENDNESEFRKFIQKFKDNAELNKDYQTIYSKLLIESSLMEPLRETSAMKER